MRPIPLRTRRFLVHAPRPLVFEAVASLGKLVERRSDREQVVEFVTGRGDGGMRLRELATLHHPERIEYRSLDAPVERVEESIALTEPAPGATTITYRGRFWMGRGPRAWLQGLRAKRAFDRLASQQIEAGKHLAERSARRRAGRSSR
jgi:hypothetical protein